MKLTLFGAVIGAAMLALAAPAGAASFDGTGTINNQSISPGLTNFTVSPANGNSGASFTHGQQYFDYIVGFTLSGPSDVTIASSPTVGTNLKDYHTALFSPQPDPTGMFFDSNNGLNINLLGTLTPTATGGTTLTALSLASGSYFLHLFGVIAGQGQNSFLTGLSGSITTTAVAATPIPAGLPLFVTALGALGFAVRRRKTPAGNIAA